MGSKILWAIISGFLTGVGAQSFFSVGITAVIFAELLALFSFALPIIDRKYARYSIIVTISLIFFSIGVMRMDAATLHADPVLASHIDMRITIAGVVADEPDVRETSVLVPVSVNALVMGSSSRPVYAKILAQAPSYTEVSYGDIVRVSGTLRLPKSFDAGLGR